MKQKFKGKTLTRTKVVNNIIKFYEKANQTQLQDGRDWYRTASRLGKSLAAEFNVMEMNMCGVIAALSPQTSWELNKVYARRFMLDGMKAMANTTAMKEKAEACLKATSVHEIWNILNGNKIQRFFHNIHLYYEDGFVTIDRHAIAIAIQDVDNVKALPQSYGQMTDPQYQFFEECYRLAAQKLQVKYPHRTKLNAHQLQAITWLVYRKRRNLK